MGAIWKTRKEYLYKNMKTDNKKPGCQDVELNYLT